MLADGVNRGPFAMPGPHADGGGVLVRVFHPAAHALELRPMAKGSPAGVFVAPSSRPTAASLTNSSTVSASHFQAST